MDFAGYKFRKGEVNDMKKTCRTIFLMAAFTLGLFIFSNTGEAAGQITGLKQDISKTTANAITLAWDAVPGLSFPSCYEVLFSTDGATNWQSVGTSYTPSTVIGRLSPGQVFYAKVQIASSKETGESAPVLVSTRPEPADVGGLKQTDATTSSISMSWSAVAGATNYEVYRSDGVNNYTLIGATADTSFKVTGLGASQYGKYFIIACSTTAAGVTGKSRNYITTTMKTAPGKVSTLSMSNFWPEQNKARYQWTDVQYADGFQFQLLDKKDKVLHKASQTVCWYDHTPIYKNKFVRCRVRAYIKIGDKKVYGSWSPSQWNAYPKKLTAKRTKDGKKLKVTWSKISGISKYEVSVSTSKDSGYKKYKSLGSKKTSCSITKCGKKKLKKNKRYYVRIKYVTKEDGKSITSNVYSRIQER